MPDAFDRTFRIRVAKASDARLVHTFLFARPDNHIRELTLDDVIVMIRDRVVLIAESSTQHGGWDIAGACYIAGPSGDEPGDFELGGAYVAPEYRGFGIFRTLATAAIVHHLAIDGPIESGDALIAHVHEKNAWPRHTLEKLGFKLRDADVAYKPDAIPGLGHMPLADDGCIHADTYAFPPTQYVDAIQELLIFPGKITGKDGCDRELAITVSALATSVLTELLPATLEELVKHGYLSPSAPSVRPVAPPPQSTPHPEVTTSALNANAPDAVM